MKAPILKQVSRRTLLASSLAVAGLLSAPMLGSTYTHNLMPIASAQAASEQGQGGHGAGGEMQGPGGVAGHGGAIGGNRTTDVNDILRGHGRDALSGSGRPDDKGPPEGEGPPNDMGGGNPDAGDRKGDLFGELAVILRDDNGEPVLDDFGRLQYLDVDGNVIPYLSDDPEDEGFTEVSNPDAMLEVELERLNIARSPDNVIARAYNEALDTIASDADGVLEYDAAGRIVVVQEDGTELTIDSPVENLALYLDAMTNPDTVWTLDDAKSFLAAAASKFGVINLDIVINLNNMLDINDVEVNDLGVPEGEYYDLTGYTYDRTAAFTSDVDADGDGVLDPVTVTYLTDPEGDGTYVYVTEPLMTVVFGDTAYEGSGADAFAQAADDAVQVIEFIHEPIH